MVTHEPFPHSWKRLGDYLRQSRVSQNVTQEFTATWLRVDRRTIARIEAGLLPPTVFHLAALEAALGLPPGSSLAVLAGRAPDGHHPTLVNLPDPPTICGHDPNCT